MSMGMKEERTMRKEVVIMVKKLFSVKGSVALL